MRRVYPGGSVALDDGAGVLRGLGRISGVPLPGDLQPERGQGKTVAVTFHLWAPGARRPHGLRGDAYRAGSLQPGDAHSVRLLRGHRPRPRCRVVANVELPEHEVRLRRPRSPRL